MLDLTTLYFGSAYVQRNGQKMVPMSTVPNRTDYHSRVTMQLGDDQDSMLFSEYGISTPLPGADPNRRNMEARPTPALAEFLANFDAHVVKTATDRCSEFFKAERLTREYVPMLRTDASGNHAVRFKVIVGGDNCTELRLFRSENKVARATYECAGRDSHVLVIVNSPGIWYNATQYGVSLTARSILVRPAVRSTGIAAFNLKPGVVEDDEPEDGAPVTAYTPYEDGAP